MRMRSLLPAVLLAAACSDAAAPAPSIEGAWEITAFWSDGEDAVVGNDAAIVFDPGGIVVINAIVTFPGEAPDTLADAGTWTLNGAILHLVVGGDDGEWVIDFDGSDQLVLQLQNDASATRLTLERVI